MNYNENQQNKHIEEDTMIRSMTGFGRCEIQRGEKKFTVEIKGVNHRYLDANIRMPKKLYFFETAIRTYLKRYVQRGKVDIFISYEDLSQGQMSLKYNEALAAEYLDYFRQMEEKFNLENDVRISSLSRYPEVFTMEEQDVDEDEMWNGLKEALDGACVQFVKARETEGEKLRDDLTGKLDAMKALVEKIEERSPADSFRVSGESGGKSKGAPSGYSDRGKPYRRGGCDFCGQDLYR